MAICNTKRTARKEENSHLSHVSSHLKYLKTEEQNASVASRREIMKIRTARQEKIGMK